MQTLFDDKRLTRRVEAKGKGDFPFVVYSSNAPLAAFARDHMAIAYAERPSELLRIESQTADGIIESCRALPRDEGRNILKSIADRLEAEVGAWDDEPVAEPTVEVE